MSIASLRRPKGWVLVASLLLAVSVSHAGVIVGQLAADLQGPWQFRADNPGNFANTYQQAGTHFVFAGEVATATWSAQLPTGGLWSVEMWMPSRSATSNALLAVQQGAQGTQFRLNQTDGAARWSGAWLSLGVYDLAAGGVDVVLDNAGASGGDNNVAAMTGAVRFARLADGMTPFIIDSQLGPVSSDGAFYTETQGSWISSSAGSPLWGESRISNTPGAETVFSGMPLAAGLYALDLEWGTHSNRTQAAMVTIVDALGTEHTLPTINQQVSSNGWHPLGVWNLDFAGGVSEVRIWSEDGAYVSSDALRLTLIPEPATLALLGLGGLALLRRRK